MGSSVHLDGVEYIKISCPWEDSNPRRPARSNTVYAIPAPRRQKRDAHLALRSEKKEGKSGDIRSPQSNKSLV
jgi:hypothetical protein